MRYRSASSKMRVMRLTGVLTWYPDSVTLQPVALKDSALASNVQARSVNAAVAVTAARGWRGTMDIAQLLRWYARTDEFSRLLGCVCHLTCGCYVISEPKPLVVRFFGLKGR